MIDGNVGYVIKWIKIVTTIVYIVIWVYITILT